MSLIQDDTNYAALRLLNIDEQRMDALSKMNLSKKKIEKEQKINYDLYQQSVAEKKKKVETKYETQMLATQKKVDYFDKLKDETAQKLFNKQENTQYEKEKEQLQEIFEEEIKRVTEKYNAKLKKLEETLQKKTGEEEAKTQRYLDYLTEQYDKAIVSRNDILSKKEEELSAFNTIPKSRTELKYEEELQKNTEYYEKLEKDYAAALQVVTQEKQLQLLRDEQRKVRDAELKREEALQKKIDEEKHFERIRQEDAKRLEALIAFYKAQGVDYDPLNPPKTTITDTPALLFSLTEKDEKLMKKKEETASKCRALRNTFKEVYPTLSLITSHYAKNNRIILIVEDSKETVLFYEWFDNIKAYNKKYDYIEVSDYDEEMEGQIAKCPP
jgi:hypothetical protein